MTDNQVETFIVKISSELAALNANLKNILEKISDHEVRLYNLETKKDSGTKTNMINIIMLLVKTVLISTIGFVTLCGAGSIIAKIFGV